MYNDPMKKIRLLNGNTLHDVSVWGQHPVPGVVITGPESPESVMWTHENVDVSFLTYEIEIGEERKDPMGEYSDLVIGDMLIGYVDCHEYELVEKTEEKVVTNE